MAFYNHPPEQLFDVRVAGGAALRTRFLASTMWNGRLVRVVVEG